MTHTHITLWDYQRRPAAIARWASAMLFWILCVEIPVFLVLLFRYQ